MQAALWPITDYYEAGATPTARIFAPGSSHTSLIVTLVGYRPHAVSVKRRRTETTKKARAPKSRVFRIRAHDEDAVDASRFEKGG